ncbi:hypothetical protein [Pedococcus bigeumensis]|uniref:Uncharacterized protein n=1 Tax=Pedococcus bigeumensis TaxID=433644 RepID=A0A502CTT3_9MICO|nr:hypothetical protein [Pedococcus bigeumensis]TPG17035.1 hypothetical protein EAH86_09675 [Pedococcus bigeumensis]
MTPEETARQFVPRSAYGMVALWAGLAAGVALFAGFFIPLPIPVLVLGLLVVLTSSVVLARDQVRAGPGEPKTRLGRIRRFLRWLFLMLP